MKSFIRQSIMESSRANCLSDVGAMQNQPCTDNEIEYSVKSNKVLYWNFKEKCHDSISALKKFAKEVYFYVPG